MYLWIYQNQSFLEFTESLPFNPVMNEIIIIMKDMKGYETGSDNFNILCCAYDTVFILERRQFTKVFL